MIIFRQKDFSKFDTLDKVFNTAIPRICLEIMKCIEMYETEDVYHWIKDKIVKTINEVIVEDLTPQTLLCLGFDKLSNKDLVGAIGNSNVVTRFYSLYRSPEDFIKTVKYRLLTETKKGEPKYKDWFDNNPIQYTDGEYVDFYKYISLCLSGQLDPDIDDFDWDIEKVLKRTKVDYSLSGVAKDKLLEIVSKSITNIVHRLYPTLKSKSISFNNLLI